MSELKPIKRFPIGNIVSTQGALAACPQSRLLDCLARHMSGDWGCVCDNDKAENDLAVEQGFRILPAYSIDPAKPCKVRCRAVCRRTNQPPPLPISRSRSGSTSAASDITLGPNGTVTGSSMFESGQEMAAELEQVWIWPWLERNC